MVYAANCEFSDFSRSTLISYSDLLTLLENIQEGTHPLATDMRGGRTQLQAKELEDEAESRAAFSPDNGFMADNSSTSM